MRNRQYAMRNISGSFKYCIAYCALIIAYCLTTSCGDSDHVVQTDSVDTSLSIPGFKFTRTDEAPTEGYFFIAPFKTRNGASKRDCFLMILDAMGKVVWFKDNITGSNFQCHDNGTMSYYGKDKFYIMNNDFRVIDSVKGVNIESDAHELLILPNGHYMLLGQRSDTVDGSSITRPKDSHWLGAEKVVIKYGVAEELDENKKLIWLFDAKDHFQVENMDPAFVLDSAKIELPHFNAIDIDSLGNFLLTARYTNEVIYVNKETNAIEWRLGGNHSDFTFVNDSVPFYGQHAAHFLPNGNILLFDNGYTVAGKMHNARALEYQLDLKKKTATLVWSWEYPRELISESTGNAERYDDGSTLMCFGKIFNRSPNIMFALVNSKGEMEIQCSFDDTLGTYRTYFYPSLPFEVHQ